LKGTHADLCRRRFREIFYRETETSILRGSWLRAEGGGEGAEALRWGADAEGWGRKRLIAPRKSKIVRIL